MRDLKVYVKTAMLFVLVFVVVPSMAQEKPSVIPYQGQLANQEGRPVNPDDPLILVFRIYSEPIGGTPTWQEVHDNVSVVGGRFSVLLGARIPFRDLGMFKRTVYLGVTIDDGIPETADIEMRPRQAIVPVISASYAAEADRAHALLGGIPGEIPVGGITMYGGAEASLPDNWVICDGRVVNDPLSPFHGRQVPDLRSRFVRGSEGVSELGQPGGREQRDTHNHRVTSGAHGHRFANSIYIRKDSVDSWRAKHILCGDPDDDGRCEEPVHGFWLSGGVNNTSDKRYLALVVDTHDDPTRGATSHSHLGSVSGHTSRTGNYQSTTTYDQKTDFDNRPPYMNLHYIIRIR